MIHLYPDQIFLLPWRGGALAYRPWSGWTRLLNARQARSLRPAGRCSVAPWQRLAPFRPECLTVLLQQPCNLACSYCYGEAAPPGPREPDELHHEALLEAAHTVAHNAHQRDRAMVLGFHGACEPLLVLPKIQRFTDSVRELTRRHGVKLELQTTTNGMLGTEALQWASQNLHGVTLSWDGAAAVHDAQRPRRDGGGSHAAVMQALELLLRSPLRLRVRTTVTRRSCATLERDVLELARGLSRGVVFQPEPVFGKIPDAGYPPSAPDPEEFCRAYLRLAVALESTHSRVELAGARLDVRHGRHCAIWQQNMAVTTHGEAVACFLPAAWHSTRLAPDGDELQLQRLRSCSGSDLEPCSGCFARDHCARHCPHHCPLVDPHGPADPRLCRLNRRVLFAQLLARAGQRVTMDDLPDLLAAIHNGPDQRMGVFDDDLPPPG